MAFRRTLKIAAAAASAACGAYAAYVGVTWLRYGHPSKGFPGDEDPLLDQFMPAYDVVERQRTFVRAPAGITFEAACEQDLQRSPIVNGIFRARQLVLGGAVDETPRPRGLVALTRSLGWGVLAERPGREIVMGAVTQPWFADVVFRAVEPERFAAFDEPDHVKIVWTLRADPAGDRGSIFRTETRVATTDAAARAKFRRYWAAFSPGIILIRRLSLGPLRRAAEARHRAATAQRLVTGG